MASKLHRVKWIIICGGGEGISCNWSIIQCNATQPAGIG